MRTSCDTDFARLPTLFEMNTSAACVVTEANEGNEGRPSSSFSSLPSVNHRAFGLAGERDEAVATNFEQAVFRCYY
jgi:hypothetical protein